MTRRFLLIAAVFFGAMASPLFAQAPFRVITRPKIPSQEVIERLGLAFGWHARVPMEGPLDSVYSVQVIPRGTGDAIKTEVVVQTTAGAVYLFDGESGALRWNTPVGIRYSPMYPVAFNAQSIVVTRRDMFYLLHRDTGMQRVYKKNQGERDYGVRLDGMPSAAPAANDELLAFSFPDRVTTFLVPDFDRIGSARDKDAEVLAQEKGGSVQPIPYWDYYDPTMKLTSPPTIMATQISVTAADGRVISLAPAFQARVRLRFEFRTLGGIAAPMGSLGDFGYIGGQDYNLYAVDLFKNRLAWRFASGAPILQKPNVNDADVFVVSQGRGMFRVHRYTGKSYWLEPTAERFLAAHYFKGGEDKFKVDNQDRVLAKYVYVADRLGKLLVVDGDRGGVLAQYDTSDWQTPIVNEWTDRIYLGNQDGQILSLHPRNSRRPQVNKSIVGPRNAGDDRPAPPADVPAPKKDDEKKADEKAALEVRPQDVVRCESLQPTAIARNDRIMTASSRGSVG